MENIWYTTLKSSILVGDLRQTFLRIFIWNKKNFSIYCIHFYWTLNSQSFFLAKIYSNRKRTNLKFCLFWYRTDSLSTVSQEKKNHQRGGKRKKNQYLWDCLHALKIKFLNCWISFSFFYCSMSTKKLCINCNKNK